MLDNGLKLIVREDHRAPIVITQLWYRVGGAYEHNGATGISHALEHMMFKGTPQYPSGQFSKIISENGGQHNAFTGHDYTAFYQKIDPGKLALCFELESDRMRNLLLSEEEFSKEINVIKEERRLRIDDDPEALMRERFLAGAHLNNPYQHPVIGWMSDINNLKIEDLRTWYKTWYVPNNAVLVVVGDVVPEQVLSLAKQYFEKIPSKEIPTLKYRNDEPSLGERRIDVTLPAKLPNLIMGYNVPNIHSANIHSGEENWEPYGLMVLIMALDGGNSSRFSRHLIRGESLASQLSTSYDPFQLFPGLITFSGIPANGKTITDLEKGILKEIHNLQNELLNDQELKRVKTKVIAAHIYAKDSITSQATELGTLESIGLSWKLSEEYLGKIEAITAKQVQQLAKKYLTQENRTITYLTPESGPALNSELKPKLTPEQTGN